MCRSKWASFILFASAWLCSPALGFAQEKPYPTKSVTYLVTFDPGGQSDREARGSSPSLKKSSGRKSSSTTKSAAAAPWAGVSWCAPSRTAT